ncbi:capsular biosynthesis protein [Neorhizobium sp. SOG26]|nr:capsular biosynthesis protein [Neorhizobium sp. SOG26]
MTAVVLRDIRTRFFNHGLGFFVTSLWPLVHMLVLLAIYNFTGRRAPYGESLNVFFATGLVPTLLFSYVSRYMAVSVVNNRQMMSFPIVRLLDIVFARAYLEAIGGILTLVFMIGVLLVLGDDPWPSDVQSAVSAYLAALFLGLGAGVLVASLAVISPFFTIAWIIICLVLYIGSGTLFVVSKLPEQVAYALSWNPVLHCVEWMRTAYYPTYSDKVLDKAYVLWTGLGFLFCGLGFERVARRRLMDG